jgi:hypothetical protein
LQNLIFGTHNGALIRVKNCSARSPIIIAMLEQLDRADSPAALAEQKLRERDVIALVAALVRELHPQRIRFIDILPSSRIERDLGIDSLALQLPICFEVRALSGGLVSSTPE